MSNKSLTDFHQDLADLLRKYGYQGYVGMIWDGEGVPWLSKIFPPYGVIRARAVLIETKLATWLSEASGVTFDKHISGLNVPGAKKN